jgi:hypothetical protein
MPSSLKTEEEIPDYPPLPDEHELRAGVYKIARRKSATQRVARWVAENAVLRCRALVHRLGINLRSTQINQNSR